MLRIQDALAARRQELKTGEDKGFTLIELLVVIIIIGILAAIAIPVFLNQREAAWKSSVESDVKNLVLAVETYSVANNGKVPTSGGPFTGVAPTTNAFGATSGITVTVSPNNTLTYSATGNAYTITGQNSDLGAPTYTYVSSNGKGSW